MNQILYRGGYKYQLAETFFLQTDIRPGADIITSYVLLSRDGALCILSGYAWDGPSGPAPDTPDFMRASLVHDALYQLMREGHLDPAEWRDDADKLLRTLCIEDGMPHLEAELAYMAVRGFASVAADPSSNKAPVRAP
jgi:hypothetical protein